MMNFTSARQNMIECQLRPNRVIDERLLDAVFAVPRENFVPAAVRSVAYVDEAIRLPNGRAVPEPMVTGRLLQEAQVAKTDNVLNIGGATGYTTAILARLAAHVTMVEADAALAALAQANLQGCANVTVKTGALAAGEAASGPYDLIFIDGGMQELPPALLAQLKDGGRLLAVKLDKGSVGQAMLW